MNQELVRLTTQDVSKAIPVADSFVVAEKFSIKHSSILRIINKYKKDFEDFGKLCSDFKSDLKSMASIQKSNKHYLLNEEQFYLLLTYLKNTEIARKWKREFVRQFMFYKYELLARQNTRHIGKSTRINLTDAIKNNVIGDGNFKNFTYSTYSKLIYKKVLGKQVNKIKKELGLKQTDNIRDFLTIEQLEKIQDLESKIATYIEMRKDIDDKEVYNEVKKYVEKLMEHNNNVIE